ncbi:MAG: N-acetylmuramoyl-L-alanine amidase [Myxococcota bacterium]
MKRLSLRLVAVFLMLTGCAVPTEQADPAQGALQAVFRDASDEFSVPEDLLLAVAHAASRFQQGEADEHLHQDAHGIMQLRNDEAHPALRMAAERLGESPEALKHDVQLNVRGAAALLQRFARRDDGSLPGNLEDWRTALGRLAAGDDMVAGDIFADDVFSVLRSGARVRLADGSVIVIEGRPVGRALSSTTQGLEGIPFVAASTSNYSAGRGGAPIQYVVIHTVQGSYAGAISWFRNPAAQVSAHYVIRSSDGAITQMVNEGNTAWHAGNFTYNQRSIGIEHEGFVGQPEVWYTPEMYAASAALVADICDRYGIPKDRGHIIGHVEVPGSTHTDPGSGWDWDYFMSLVQGGASQPPPQNACGDVTYAGYCDGATLVWCENGALKSVNCAERGKACGWESDAVGHNCVVPAEEPPPAQEPPAEDPCGGLTYQGTCSGGVLSWCENGAVKVHDCAAGGQGCGWESDAVGYNCTGGCGELDYAGGCHGSSLRWCENGAVRVVDCAGSGQSCGWQSDAVGYNCL